MSQILLGKSTKQIKLNLKMLNRHGLIAGATGTGKTVTLKIIAEALSNQGVPVFIPDVKDDVSGLAIPGSENEKVTERIEKIGIEDFEYRGFPVIFWDLYQKNGHPVRTTVAELGPLLFSRLLSLTTTQESILSIIFQIAEDKNMALINLQDLKDLIEFVVDNRQEFSKEYGRMATPSLTAILRQIIAMETDQIDLLFGEPAINIYDFMKTDSDGKGHVNILSARDLILNPKLYATFLLWLLTKLYEDLPEVGDLAKPKFVMFFDEAHLLFDEMPDTVIDKIKQIILLIRSKGVGVFFITQNPKDINEDVRAQLSNRIQHALRTYSPKERKAIKSIVESFPENAKIDDLAALIQELGVGEAVVSTLNAKGIPSQAEHVLICPPRSQFSPISEAQRAEIIKSSIFYGQYEKSIDSYSASEEIEKIAAQQKLEAEANPKKEKEIWL